LFALLYTVCIGKDKLLEEYPEGLYWFTSF